jgi:hypothetical protein
MTALVAVALLLTAVVPAYSQGSRSEKELPMRTQTSFDLVVSAPYAEAAALFGPEGERGWAGESWDPKFIYPQPARDVEDSVFTISHGHGKAIWVTALHDIEGRHFKYVYVLDDLLVTTIDVRFTTIDGGSTSVHVVYTRTALTPEAIEHVQALTQGDARAGTEWQQAIDSFLAKAKKSAMTEHQQP